MRMGTSASPGIGIGTAVRLKQPQFAIDNQPIENPAKEKELLDQALKDSRLEVEALLHTLQGQLKEQEQEILKGHLLLLNDSLLIKELEDEIESGHICAALAAEQVFSRYAQIFAAMDDDLMRQRQADMEDIKLRIQNKLLKLPSMDLSDLPQGSVLVASDLTPSMTVSIRPDRVEGIVTELGGSNSHSAILARALGIPAVVAVAGLMDDIRDGDWICLDGDRGELAVNPNDQLLLDFRARKAAFLAERQALEAYIEGPAVTRDGTRIQVFVNIGHMEEANKVKAYGGTGVGLFRTEFLFMNGQHIPTEQQQFEIYKKTVLALEGRPLVIRTLDVGGDKDLPALDLKKEDNPYLGYRGIRLCLDRAKTLFRPQLRALLRAGVYGDIRIMIPMVTCVEEIHQVKALMAELSRELSQEGIAHNRKISLGAMIETPAAACIADLLAEEVDFFSIGSNDLTQYTMAVDRGNQLVSYLYSTFHPAVLRSIRHIIACGMEKGIEVSMCGEAAADRRMLPLLLAFGLKEFSMSGPSVATVKKGICGYHMDDCVRVAEQVMKMTTAGQIEDFLNRVQLEV